VSISLILKFVERLSLCAGLTLFGFSGGAAAEDYGVTRPVTVQITNATSKAALRCQLILAHFVTYEADALAKGQETTLELLRGDQDGTLIFSGKDGRQMALENLLCGFDDDWDGSQKDLNLAQLRGGTSNRLEIICSGADRLTCQAARTNK
jgi:hypothetical protein